MTIQSNLQLLDVNMQLQLESKDTLVPVLAGAPGTAKTAHVKQLARDKKAVLINVSMASLAIEILSGLPTDVDAPELHHLAVNGQSKTKYTLWSIPEIIATCAKQSSDLVILLLDDIHETNPGVQPYLYEMLLEKKIKGYKLPDNTVMIATSNTSDQANFKGFSSAIINRLSFLEWSLTLKDMKGIIKNPSVYTFLKAHQEYLSEVEDTKRPFGTPRSWTQLANHFDKMEVPEIAYSFVSKKAATEFIKHYNLIQSINIHNLTQPVDVSSMSTINQQLMASFVYYNQDIDLVEGMLLMNKDNNLFIQAMALNLDDLVYNFDMEYFGSQADEFAKRIFNPDTPAGRLLYKQLNG